MAMQLSGSLVISGSIVASAGITGSFSGNATSASYADTLGGLPSSSFAPASTFNTVSSSFATTSGSLSTRVTNLESTSSTLTSASASFATTSGSIAGRVTLIEGQYATTGSNTFTGPQYVNQASNAISFTSTASLYTDGGLRVTKDSFVSGTAYFNNVIVYGTASIQYVTSSQVNVGTNIITVNTDTPTIRFGGLSVFDSGSTQLTGSILWDSEKNNWIYSNPSGSTYNSGMLMNGPKNTGSLGSEQGTLNNYITKGQGGDHITSSQIIDDGTTVQIPGNLQVTGSLINTGAATFSSSALITGVLTLSSTISNGTYTFTLPSATGTLALTSALSSYLPLTGGTLTGALGGTTGTFTGSLTMSGIVCTSTSTFSSLATFNGNISLGGNSTYFSSGAVTLGGALGGTSATFSSTVQVGNNTANATLNISSDNGSGDSFLNFMADSNVIKAQIYGHKFGGTGGVLEFKTLQSSVLTTALTLSSTGAATFSSNVTADSQLSILGGDGGGKRLKFTGGVTFYNGMIAVQENYGNVLEITASSAAGTTTFNRNIAKFNLGDLSTTLAGTLSVTGAATFSSSVTSTQGNFINAASNFTLTIDKSTQSFHEQVERFS